MKIILTILKCAGIGIGVLLLVVLFFMLLVFFVPVRYELNGENMDEIKAEAKAHWLFRIINFRVNYEENEMKMVLRIFGVPVWKK